MRFSKGRRERKGVLKYICGTRKLSQCQPVARTHRLCDTATSYFVPIRLPFILHWRVTTDGRTDARGDKFNWKLTARALPRTGANFFLVVAGKYSNFFLSSLQK